MLNRARSFILIILTTLVVSVVFSGCGGGSSGTGVKRVSGDVRSAKTNTGKEGVGVAATSEETGKTTPVVLTDSEGKFELEGLPANEKFQILITESTDPTKPVIPLDVTVQNAPNAAVMVSILLNEEENTAQITELEITPIEEQSRNDNDNSDNTDQNNNDTNDDSGSDDSDGSGSEDDGSNGKPGRRPTPAPSPTPTPAPEASPTPGPEPTASPTPSPSNPPYIPPVPPIEDPVGPDGGPTPSPTPPEGDGDGEAGGQPCAPSCIPDRV